MTPFLLALWRAITSPDGSSGELLSTRRKYHLLQAEWYSRLAARGEKERAECDPATPAPQTTAARKP